MSDRRRALGAIGEQVAAQHLESKGYTIVDRNVRGGHGEIDIVARSPDGVLAFVEVRTRSVPGGLAAAAESLTPSKRRRMAELAAAYLAERAPDASARIDVVTIAVAGDGRIVAIEHIENAVEN